MPLLALLADGMVLRREPAVIRAGTLTWVSSGTHILSFHASHPAHPPSERGRWFELPVDGWSTEGRAYAPDVLALIVERKGVSHDVAQFYYDHSFARSIRLETRCERDERHRVRFLNDMQDYAARVFADGVWDETALARL